MLSLSLTSSPSSSVATAATPLCSKAATKPETSSSSVSAGSLHQRGSGVEEDRVQGMVEPPLVVVERN